jgi:hypothetical protein
MIELNGRTDMKDAELRDWFAGQALGGIMANSHYPAQGSEEPFDQYAARVTEGAYKIAEAMMKQGRRLKKEASLRPG